MRKSIAVGFEISIIDKVCFAIGFHVRPPSGEIRIEIGPLGVIRNVKQHKRIFTCIKYISLFTLVKCDVIIKHLFTI